MMLYEAIILSTHLYSADVWPLTGTLTKRLNTAYHRWQTSVLGISSKDRVTDEEVRVRTGQHSMDDFLSERRLHWLGHLIQMDHQCIPWQALHWEVPGFKGGPGRPCTNWRSTVNKDLLRIGITWEEAEVAAQNRSEWCRSVAQCIHLDVGWIKVKVKDRCRL